MLHKLGRLAQLLQYATEHSIVSAFLQSFGCFLMYKVEMPVNIICSGTDWDIKIS